MSATFRYRWVLVGLPLLLMGTVLLRSTAVAQEVAPLAPVPQSDPFFGIVQSIHDPDRAVEAGVTWERLVLWWSQFQPTGPEDWRPEGWFPRNLIQDQKNRGIEPVAVVLHTPGWAARDGLYDVVSPPKGIELPFDHPENYWGQFLTRLSAEYAGLVDHWILYNEPDIYREQFANWAGTEAEFARMQAVGYRAIKAGNPNATVILTGTTYWWDLENDRTLYLDRLLAALGREPGAAENNHFFDALSVHQYSNPLNSYAVPVAYRRLMSRYGLTRPIWIIESNVVPYDDPIAVLPRGGLRATMREQAYYVIQSIALARAAGVERYSIYKMRDENPENDQFFGLVRNDGSPRPAYIAFQVAARELAGVSDARYFWGGSATPPTGDEITALLASPDYAPQFVWPDALNGVRMRRGNDRVTVLWNASAAPIEVGVRSAAPVAEVVTPDGRRRQIARGADGAFRLTLAGSTNNTDARDPRLNLVGGEPLILIEPGQAAARDPLPAKIDACWGVPGAQLPERPTPAEAWVAPTGYAVGGPWLDFLRANGDIDYAGLPRSPVIQDPLDPEQCVQYFQRLVLEWHPDNAPEHRIQRRLLVEEQFDPTPAPPAAPTRANGNDYWYFAKGPNGLGHAVSNQAPDGTPIGFKAYFDRNGRERAFGYPMEPPTLRRSADGTMRWTQRFQAAILEYHPEFDRDGTKPGTALPWRTWRVQLRLLGDEYIAARGVPYVSGDPVGVRLTPP